MKLPISIKGIVFESNKVWLRKNERNEWELPGGKLDEGEQPEETVIREMKEELGFHVVVKDIVQSYVYTIQPKDAEPRDVLVVSYLCDVVSQTGQFELIGEAGEAVFRAFSLEEVVALNMPDFYKKAIKKAAKTIRPSTI